MDAAPAVLRAGASVEGRFLEAGGVRHEKCIYVVSYSVIMWHSSLRCDKIAIIEARKGSDSVLNENAKRFIENFYRKNYRALFLHAYSMLGRREEAEVAVQEAFAVACKKPEEFMSTERPIRWMEKTVENMAMHIMRERKYTAALFSPFEELAPGKEPSTLDGSSFELIEFCQNVVPEDELKFFLRIAEGSSTFTIEAERLGIKLTTCYKRFERTREKLQRALDKYHKDGM